MAHIFFSYTRNDKQRVEPIITALEAQGWTVWWDRAIGGGDSWNDVIEAELKSARCVIVAWSSQSAKSDWVREEAGVAKRARKLVPVLLEPMEPPFGFGGVQALDFSEWSGSSEALEFVKLGNAVRAKLGEPLPPPPPPPPQPHWRRLRPALVSLTAAALLIAAAAWWFYPVRKSDFRVFVQFEGLDRPKVKAMMQNLQAKDWTVEGAELGGEKRAEAAGLNEIRYRENERAAKLLAADVQSQRLTSDPIVLRRNSGVASSNLEVWISKPIPPAPPGQPQTQQGQLKPSSPPPISDDEWKKTPDSAFCYQRNFKVGAGKYLARCFQTNELCLQQNSAELGQFSSCARITGLLAVPTWRGANPGGILNSWFKYSESAFPSPFPSVPQN